MQLKIFFFLLFVCVCRKRTPRYSCQLLYNSRFKKCRYKSSFFFKINCKKKIYSNSSLVDHVLGDVYRYRTPPVVHRRKKAPK